MLTQQLVVLSVKLPQKPTARKLGEYAIQFMKKGKPSLNITLSCKLFHTDSVFCGISALALKTNDPTVLAQQCKPYHWQKKQEHLQNLILDLPMKFGSLLSPFDYSYAAIRNQDTRKLMDLTEFEHRGKEYDDKYPEGISSRVQILLKDGKNLDSQFIMFQSGHTRNGECDLEGILNNKFEQLGKISIKDPAALNTFYQKLRFIDRYNNRKLKTLYNCEINYDTPSIDDQNISIFQRQYSFILIIINVSQFIV